MPTIHMIHGFTGAGKTTFSKKLALETDAARFSPDEWMTRLYGANPPAEKFDAYYAHVDALILAEARKILQSGGDVIFDFGFWKRAERNAARAFAEENGADVKLYSLQCPEEVMKKRVLARTAALPEGELMIDENAFNQFKSRFEPLDPAAEKSIAVKTDA